MDDEGETLERVATALEGIEVALTLMASERHDLADENFDADLDRARRSVARRRSRQERPR